jgi:hypothetical protein
MTGVRAMAFMYELELNHIIDTAFSRLYADMAEAAPFMAPQVVAWMRDAGRETVDPAERKITRSWSGMISGLFCFTPGRWSLLRNGSTR